MGCTLFVEFDEILESGVVIDKIEKLNFITREVEGDTRVSLTQEEVEVRA